LLLQPSRSNLGTRQQLLGKHNLQPQVVSTGADHHHNDDHGTTTKLCGRVEWLDHVLQDLRWRHPVPIV